MNEQENKKREQSLQNSSLEKLRSFFVLDLPTFYVKDKGKCALSKDNLVVCFAQSYSNLLQELFFCDFVISMENIYNELTQNNTKNGLYCKGMGKVEERNRLHYTWI